MTKGASALAEYALALAIGQNEIPRNDRYSSRIPTALIGHVLMLNERLNVPVTQTLQKGTKRATNVMAQSILEAMSEEPLIDPFLKLPVTVRTVQPFQARKLYVCPACGRDIPVGMGHLVVVPDEAADLRRHWHRGCWDARSRRRPGR